MTDTLQTRLREPWTQDQSRCVAKEREAADYIDTLEAEIKRLREALNKSRCCLTEMSATAYTVGLQGTSDWDKIAGGSDIYGTIDSIDAALAVKGDADE